MCRCASGPEKRLLDTHILCLYKDKMRFRVTAAFVAALQLLLAACIPIRPGSPKPPESTGQGSSLASPAVNAPIATETPVPIVHVTSGDRALFNGDYEAATVEYEAAASSSGDEAVRTAALWGLARALYSDGHYDAALERTNDLTTNYPESPYAAPAHFLSGQCLKALNCPVDAAGGLRGLHHRAAGCPGFLRLPAAR